METANFALPTVVIVGSVIVGLIIAIVIASMKASTAKGDKASKLFSYIGWFLVAFIASVVLIFTLLMLLHR